jgi:hypothetical protein
MNERLKNLRDHRAIERNTDKDHADLVDPLRAHEYSMGFTECHDLLMKDVEGLIDAVDDWLTDGEEEFNHQPGWQKAREAIADWKSKYGNDE